MSKGLNTNSNNLEIPLLVVRNIYNATQFTLIIIIDFLILFILDFVIIVY